MRKKMSALIVMLLVAGFGLALPTVAGEDDKSAEAKPEVKMGMFEGKLYGWTRLKSSPRLVLISIDNSFKVDKKLDSVLKDFDNYQEALDEYEEYEDKLKDAIKDVKRNYKVVTGKSSSSLRDQIKSVQRKYESKLKRYERDVDQAEVDFTRSYIQFVSQIRAFKPKDEEDTTVVKVVEIDRRGEFKESVPQGSYYLFCSDFFVFRGLSKKYMLNDQILVGEEKEEQQIKPTESGMWVKD